MAKRRSETRGLDGYRKILWPTDFSPLAKAAIPHALRLAADDAELVILHVWQLPVMYGAPPMPTTALIGLDQEVRNAAETQLHKAADEVKAKAGKVRVRTILVQGSPSRQIPRVAKRRGCDLIVLATRGRTGLRQIFLGSVAESVVRHAPCPVLTVRPARRRP